MSSVVTREEAAPAQRRGGFWRTPALLSSLVVTVAVFVANATYVLGIRSNDPMLYHSGLGAYRKGSVGGAYTIDPNDGWTVQSLGRLAAHMWANGHVPLWNSYEGLGQPLAGEMQSAALFQPFIMLQLLPNGVFAMHLVLELIAGLTTLFFLRRLGLGWVASTVGGCLFALNGAFSVMTNAPFNPIAFLPMGLLGVEMILAKVTVPRAAPEARGRHAKPWLGVMTLGAAIAWMLLAGFPETAFLEGLLIGCWALMRLFGIRRESKRRSAFAGWTIAGLALGLALAAPVVVSFLDFLSWASTAYHEDVANSISYPTLQITSLALPYAVGTLANPVMKLQAGYLTLPAVFLALVGLSGTRRRGVRILLAVTVFLLVTNMFGFEPTKLLLNHVPGVKAILVYKYGISLLEFAVAVAAAIGLDDLARRRVARRRTLICAAVVAGYAVVSLGYLANRGLITNVRWSALSVGAIAVVCVLLLVMLLRSAPGSRPVGRTFASAFAGLLLVLTGVGHFAVPQGGASTPQAVDTAPIDFLKAHLGLGRFYTLGPIQPDYGSYWGLAQLNVNDLPVPEKYGRFVLDELRPSMGGLSAKEKADNFKDYQLVPFNPKVAVEKKLLIGYAEKQQAFREAGVRYLVTRPGVVDAASASRFGLRKVLASPKTEIFEDAKAAAYYSTANDGCQISDASRTDVTVTCSAATTLTRRELGAPGWRVSVNGSTHDVAVSDAQLFQRVEVPKGTSHLTFEYRPKHFALSAALCLFGLATLVACAVMAWRGRRVAVPAGDGDVA